MPFRLKQLCGLPTRQRQLGLLHLALRRHCFRLPVGRELAGAGEQKSAQENKGEESHRHSPEVIAGESGHYVADSSLRWDHSTER
jgi:hypothetical protein